jgi:hypothetical protein
MRRSVPTVIALVALAGLARPAGRRFLDRLLRLPPVAWRTDLAASVGNAGARLRIDHRDGVFRRSSRCQGLGGGEAPCLNPTPGASCTATLASEGIGCPARGGSSRGRRLGTDRRSRCCWPRLGIRAAHRRAQLTGAAPSHTTDVAGPAPRLLGSGDAERVTSNGIRIAYDEFGDPRATPMLLIMGLGAQMILWPTSSAPTSPSAAIASSASTIATSASRVGWTISACRTCSVFSPRVATRSRDGAVSAEGHGRRRRRPARRARHRQRPHRRRLDGAA